MKKAEGQIVRTRRQAAAKASSSPVDIRREDPEAMPSPTPAVSSAAMFDSVYSLDAARSDWRFGNWDALLQIGKGDLAASPDRAKLALLLAAAHAHHLNKPLAKHFMSLALSWGCSKALAGEVLMSGLYNTLGRMELLLSAPDGGIGQFNRAINIVEKQYADENIGRVRQISQGAKLGLLSYSTGLLEREIKDNTLAKSDSSSWRSLVEAELEILHHELYLALQKGQLYTTAQRGGAVAFPSGLESEAGLKSQSLAQLGQDLWALERTGYKRGGYFVEFGATDGVSLSNTWLLENKFDWTGICAEPNPDFYAMLSASRKCQISADCIAGETGREVEFILAGVFGGISEYAELDIHKDKRSAYKGQGRTLKLTTISLHDFLKKYNAPKHIDYLSVDTEGSEYDILNGFPFEEWRIKLITVEHNFTDAREDIRMLLESKGYVRTEMQWDDWYELAE